MAVPKNRTSKARKLSRRANWKLNIPGMIKCPNCGELIKAHVVCKHCGYYKGVQVVKKAVNQ